VARSKTILRERTMEDKRIQALIESISGKLHGIMNEETVDFSEIGLGELFKYRNERYVKAKMGAGDPGRGGSGSSARSVALNLDTFELLFKPWDRMPVERIGGRF
jgi:hypothetical protein